MDPVETRWRNDKGISDLSVAVDEIYVLRALCAKVAVDTEQLLELKGHSKSRRLALERQAFQMREAAVGDAPQVMIRPSLALRNAGVEDSLTNERWAESRGLTPVDPWKVPDAEA